MIRFQLKGASQVKGYTFSSSEETSRSLDAVYALAKQHMDSLYPTMRSANIVLSYIDATSGEETVLRFPEQVAGAVGTLLTIVMKQSGSGAWHVKPGRWKKGHIVGSGSTGNVYVATSLDGANVFAVKEIMLDPETSAQALQRMKQEMSMIMKLPPHLNIVQYYGMERTTCALHVFLEYVAGGSIRTLLNRLGRPLHESVIRDYTKQMLTGLTFLHDWKIIHGDIKGGNCLVDVDGTVKLADFGSSSKADSEWIGIRGTSLWMSPECVKGAVLTTATDVWSMACTVIEMATGRPPWFELNFTNDWAAMYHLSQTERGPQIPAHLTPAAHDFLNLCFKVDASERPTTSELLQHPFVTTAAINAADVSEYVPVVPAPPSWQEASLASSLSVSRNVLDPEVTLPTFRGLRMDVGSLHLPSIAMPHNPEAYPDQVTRALRSNASAVSGITPNPLRALTEPVLFSIMLYLTPRALCAVVQLNKDTALLVGVGMGEALWKRHFIAMFGEVDGVRSALRKGWKLYYADSVKFHGVRIAEGTLRFKRRLTHARNVYEGTNELRQRIVLIVETPKHKTTTDTNSRTRTPARQVMRTHSNGPHGGGNSPNKLSGTMLGGTMLGTSPVKGGGLPALGGARMVSPAEVTKVQRIRKQQMDNIMNIPTPTGVSAYRPFQGPGSMSELYDTSTAGNNNPSLATYQRVATHLEGCPGVVRPLAFIDHPPHNVLALPYLGTSLNELLLVCGNQFSQRTVCQVALQAIDVLAELHRREVLHYCLTPSHIVVTESGHVHLINFKYARPYATGLAIPSSRRPSSGSSVRHKESLFFMSAYSQKGLTPGPRDDAIALGHVLCYLLQGGLPWITDPPPSDQELYIAKKGYVAQIARTPPLQLYHYLKHCNDLKQGEMPDYAFMKNMFLRLMTENKWTADGVFDWTSQVRSSGLRRNSS